MTRDQAANTIAKAIQGTADTPTADALHLAGNIATALDALGLLNLGKLAYHPDFKPPGQEPEDIGKAHPQPAYAGAQPVGSLPPPPQDTEDYTPENPSKRQQDWAAFRERERT